MKDTAEYREGQEAASRGHSFKNYCPYDFTSSGCKERGDQNGFERDFRPKMNAWFAGWKDWLDERGLGYNFQPKRAPTSTRGAKA